VPGRRRWLEGRLVRWLLRGLGLLRGRPLARRVRLRRRRMRVRLGLRWDLRVRRARREATRRENARRRCGDGPLCPEAWVGALGTAVLHPDPNSVSRCASVAAQRPV
ncbi:hypothetical protein, partial [Streptomyces sp. PU-14G]|uniref:hypothetical protein n=1 Tax=Streptomyces sp. PU-14G TaxID=2800808 RepID=UPI0034DF1B26